MSRRAKDHLLIAFERWGFDERGWSSLTRKQYRGRVEAADAWLQTKRSVSVVWAKPADLKAYLFSTPPTARNRNNIRQALIGFGYFLIDQGFGQVNAALSLPRLPEPGSIPKALVEQLLQRLDGAARTLGPMTDALFCLLFWAGLRKNEARTLEWGHVDEGWVRFKGKGGKERAVPLHWRAQEALGKWHVECPDPRWVFPSPKLPDRPISERYVHTLISEVGDLAGVAGLHPHLLRHSIATLLIEATGDIRTVQEFLGHADPKTTTIYTLVRPTRLKEAVDRLEFGT
jgi:integrase/recombinase XerC